MASVFPQLFIGKTTPNMVHYDREENIIYPLFVMYMTTVFVFRCAGVFECVKMCAFVFVGYHLRDITN